MSAFCTSCGKPLQENAAFCNQCGHQISPVFPAAGAVSGATEISQPGFTQKRTQRIRSVVLLVLAVVCLVGVGVGVGAWAWTQCAAGASHTSTSAARPTSKSNSSELLAKLAKALPESDAAKDSTTDQAVVDAATQASDALDPASPQNDASASAKNACSLLTVDELSTALGSSYSKAEPSTNGEDEISCEYSPGDGNIYPATLTVTLKNGKTTMATLRGVGTQMVPGTRAENDLGDASFYMPMDVGIYALKGDTLISLQFGLGKGTREQKQELVRKVLSRL